MSQPTDEGAGSRRPPHGRPRRAGPASMAATLVIVVALVGAGAFRCDRGQPTIRRPSPEIVTAAGPALPDPPEPRHVTGAELSGPTGLRLLIPGWFLDVDQRAVQPVRVTRWLPRFGGAPLLLDEAWRSDSFGRARVTSRGEPGLPGIPSVVRVSGPAVTTVAASADGGGLWLAEYHTRTTCTLREVDLHGRERRAARPVTCGTRPAAETAEGCG